MSIQAFTAGIASVPTSITDMDNENWLYHTVFQVIAGSSAGETWANSGSPSFRKEVDSRAMRKFGVDKIVYAAFEVIEVGDASADISFDSRMLIKLA